MSPEQHGAILASRAEHARAVGMRELAESLDAGAAALRRGTCESCRYFSEFYGRLCHHIDVNRNGARFQPPPGFGCTLYRGKTDDETEQQASGG